MCVLHVTHVSYLSSLSPNLSFNIDAGQWGVFKDFSTEI